MKMHDFFNIFPSFIFSIPLIGIVFCMMKVWRSSNLLKKSLRHKCFLVHFAIFKNTYFPEYLEAAASIVTVFKYVK